MDDDAGRPEPAPQDRATERGKALAAGFRFSVGEAATVLGVSERRVRQLMRRRPKTGLRRYGEDRFVTFAEIVQWSREAPDQ